MLGAPGKIWCVWSLVLTHFNVIYAARSENELDDGFVVTEDYRQDSAYSYTLTFPPSKTAENAVVSTSVATSTPRVTANSGNDELVYWGCYEYWSDRMHEFNDLYNLSYHVTPSPLECRDVCKVRKPRFYSKFLQIHSCKIYVSTIEKLQHHLRTFPTMGALLHLYTLAYSSQKADP